MLQTPSFYAHVIHGLLILVSVVFFYKNFKSIKQLDFYRKTVLLLLFTIVTGLHSLSHLGLESVYNYNPFLEI